MDNGLEIVLDPLRHSKPGEPRRKQAVSICHGVWLGGPAVPEAASRVALTDLDRVAVFPVISRLGIMAAREPPSARRRMPDVGGQGPVAEADADCRQQEARCRRRRPGDGARRTKDTKDAHARRTKETKHAHAREPSLTRSHMCRVDMCGCYRVRHTGSCGRYCDCRCHHLGCGQRAAPTAVRIGLRKPASRTGKEGGEGRLSRSNHERSGRRRQS